MPIIIQEVQNFINKYYVAPIYNDSLGYNYVNSITYGLIAVAFLFLIYKFLEKTKIKIDLNFFWALFPFILFGSSTRVLVDKNILPTTFWTVSPGIYLLTAGLFLASLVVSYFLEKKIKFAYWKTSFTIGLIIFLANLILNGRSLRFENLKFGLFVIFLTVLIFLAINFVLKKKWNWYNKNSCEFSNCNHAPRHQHDYNKKIYSLPLFAHLLDASATFVAVDFLGFVEKHPLPTFFIQTTGTAAVMYLLKLAVLIPAIYYLHKDIESENARNFFLIAIATLGLAEGIRDLMAVVFL